MTRTADTLPVALALTIWILAACGLFVLLHPEALR